MPNTQPPIPSCCREQTTPAWWKGLAVLWAFVLLLGVAILVGRVFDSVGNAASTEATPRLIDTDLLAILPHYQQKNLKETLAVIDEQRNRQLLLSVSFAVDNHADKQLLRQLINTLRDSDLFVLPNTQAQIRQSTELSKKLWNYRQQLLSRDDVIRLQNGQDNAVVEQAMAQLYGFSSIDKQLLRDDPLFLFQRYMQSTLPSELKDFTLQGEWLSKIQQQRQYYLLPLTLKQSAFDSDYQQLVKVILAELTSTVETATAGQGQFSAVGAVVFAEQGFTQSKREMSTVGLGGLLGIVLLLLWVFRSFIPLFALLTALGLSLMLALSVALWWFGSLHIFALLFSAAIVGISADYGFHFFTDVYTHDEQRASHHKPRIASVRRIFSGLTLGMISSVLAYALFAWGGFSVLSQVAVLALVGLPSMYLTVILLLPFVPLSSQRQPLPHILQRLAMFLVGNVLIKRVAMYLARPWLLALLVVLMAGVVYSIPANDDVRDLQGISSQSLAEEKRLRALFDRPYISDYTVLIGDNLDDLLTLENQWLQTESKVFYPQQAVSQLLPDLKTQQANHQAYQRLYASSVAKTYAQQLDGAVDLTLQNFQPLNVQSLARSAAIKQRFADRLVELSDGRWALLMPMRNLPQQFILPTIPANLGKNVQAYRINPTADMSAQFGNYRQQLSGWLLAVSVLLLVLGIVRYGRLGVRVALLPVLTALSALVIVAVLGFDISLFSLLAVLLLLGMGLDYVIFLAESHAPEKVMLSLCLSCATTILSFGLLAISQTTAVATFGMTVAVGMLLILLFSPVVVRTNNETIKK